MTALKKQIAGLSARPQARFCFRQPVLEKEEEEEEAEKDGRVRTAEDKSQVQFYLHSVGMGKDP